MKLFGVPIRVHPTFLWLLFFLALISGLEAVAWAFVVFTFVVLHELCHSLVARAYGIPVHDITLLPMGGVARLGAMPEDPQTELRIAVAGPLFNFAVAAVAFALLTLAGGSGLPGPLAGLLTIVLIVNLWMGLFNLLPAFPMDGGRVLRAYLTTRMGHLEATHVAARIGRWVAAVMAVIGVAALFSPRIPTNFAFLLLVAGFIFVSGKLEETMVAARHAAQRFWQFFGVAESGPGSGPPHEGRPEEEPPRAPRGEVIDVEGEVRGPDDGSAASAFRELAEQIDSHLER